MNTSTLKYEKIRPQVRHEVLYSNFSVSHADFRRNRAYVSGEDQRVFVISYGLSTYLVVQPLPILLHRTDLLACNRIRDSPSQQENSQEIYHKSLGRGWWPIDV